MRRIASSSPRALVLSTLGVTALGCGTENNYYQTTQHVYSSSSDAGAEDPNLPPSRPEPPARADAGADPDPDPDPDPEGDAGTTPPVDDGLPVADVAPEALVFDVFESIGTNYYFVVSEEQLERMNERYLGGGFPGGLFGDIYTPGGGAGGLTYTDHLFVTTTGDAPHTADFGKVQVKLVGESTGRPWTTESLPNIKIDSDEFTEGKRISGVKHMRLNNAVIGSIFREKLTLDLYEKLGYPAPRATYAWVGSSVWGPDIKVPYILVESYKPQFCKAREGTLGGECVNMWEFPGDFGYGNFLHPESCQFAECDASRVTEFEYDVITAPPGPGYKAVLAEWLDWDAFHRFQCLSWILATGDDALHNQNNLVLMERADGKFQYLPYSVDISLGQEWYSTVSLAGSNSISQGCQSDPQCWANTISTCEGLVANFAAADPVAMLNQIYADLSEREMLRSGDQERYEALVAYLQRRITELPVELELNREGPYVNYCDFGMIYCNGYCAYPEECYVCQPEPEPEPAVPGADAGAGDEAEGEPGDELAPADDRGGAGGAGGFVGAAGGAMAGVDDDAQDIVIGPFPGVPGFPVPPPGAGGGPCLPPIEIYEPPIFID